MVTKTTLETKKQHSDCEWREFWEKRRPAEVLLKTKIFIPRVTVDNFILSASPTQTQLQAQNEHSACDSARFSKTASRGQNPRRGPLVTTSFAEFADGETTAAEGR